MATVLIVDDSSFMRKRIAKAVEEAGHTVAGQAVDGAEGFEVYREQRPELVIMDITMRGTDGIRGAELIREFDPDARIIFMSMVDDEKVVQRTRELGAAGFLGKSDHARLAELINSTVQNKAGQEEI